MIKTDDITWLRIRNRSWHKTYYQRRELHNQGYVFDRKKKEWVKPSKGNDIEAASTYCKKYGFQLVVDLPQYRRNSIYRKTFFDTHPGVLGGDFYFCAYCGKIMRKQITTVDHLLSIKASQRSGIAKWTLGKLSIKNINVSKNLVPACLNCNQKKGSKSGLWLLRGLMGRHATFWFVYWFLVFIVFVTLLIYFVPMFQNLI